MLEVAGLSFSYNGTHVLRGVNAGVAPGEVLGIVGPNGAGKTTLIKCIARILNPSGGTVTLDGSDTRGLSRAELARQLAYVPQDMPVRFPVRVFDAVLAGRRPHLAWRPSKADRSRTAEILAQLGLTELALRDLDQLSGGQLQKVLLARALVQETRFLLLDEPTSSLDLRHQLEMLELVCGLAAEGGLGIVMALHDLNLAARFAHTLMLLHLGRSFCSGPPAEVITPENLREVYGVEAAVQSLNGHLTIQALACAGRRPQTKPHPGVDIP